MLNDPAALNPGRPYPRWIYHATKAPVMVSSAKEEAALGPEWSRKYIYQPYPKCKYHWSGKTTTVKSADEDKALGGGWANSPDAFDVYKRPRTTRPDQDPERWVDSWPVPG